jgi:DNA-binding LacI/PurR family transcriptional regulator
LHGLALAGQKAGYQVLTFAHRPAGQWIEAYQEMLDTDQVDGFVLSSVEYDDPRIVLLQKHGFPFVAFGRSNPGWDFPHVDVDGAAGMAMLVEHLAARGHRKIAALAWSENSRVGNNRMEGFLAGQALAGIRPEPEWIRRGEGVYQFGKQAADRLLDLPQENRPTAIVAFNDFMAIGAMQAVQARGLHVGSDIAITGFEDTPVAQYLSPALTSVRQPVLEIGKQVMTMLAGILEQHTPQETSLLLQPELIVRGSSGPERV